MPMGRPLPTMAAQQGAECGAVLCKKMMVIVHVSQVCSDCAVHVDGFEHLQGETSSVTCEYSSLSPSAASPLYSPEDSPLECCY